MVKLCWDRLEQEHFEQKGTPRLIISWICLLGRTDDVSRRVSEFCCMSIMLLMVPCCPVQLRSGNGKDRGGGVNVQRQFCYHLLPW